MNPKLAKFFKDYEDVTLIGFAWALYWRLTLVFLGVYLGIVLLVMFIALIAGA